MATINSINNKLQSLIDYANNITNYSDSDLTTAIESLASNYLVKPVLAENNTWYKGSTLKNTITKIYIVDSYTSTGNENESWNADVGNLGTVRCYVNGADLTIAGNGYGRIYANADSSYLFSGANNSLRFKSVTEIIGAELLDTSEVTTFRKAFDQDASLQSIDVSNWDTSNVTDMYAMFQACVKLEALDLSRWDVSKVTDFSYFLLSLATNPAFGEMAITTLGDISKWDVSNCGKFHGMFQACANIEKLDLSGWNTSSIVDMDAMFTNMDRLKEIKLGENFNFIDTENDETDCYLPTPNPANINGADGYWYTEDGLRYSRSEIPNNTDNTYYAVRPVEMGDALLMRTVTELSNSRVTRLGVHALRNCTSLVTLSTPNVEAIGDYALYNCTHLQTVNFEKLQTIGASGLQGCVRLTDPTFPALVSTGASALRDCGDSSDVAGMTKVVMPELTTLGNSTFYTCAKLQRVELPKVTSIGTYAFYACAALKVLILGDTPPSLADVNAFDNSAIKTNGTGYIYVPNDQVETYKAAPVWDSLADRIKSISELPA